MKLPLPIQFGSIIVADHMKFNNRDEAVGGRNYALGIMDRHTGWTDGYPQLASLQTRTQLPFDSLPLHLTKSIIVGLTMHLSLSVLAEFWAIAITFQRRIVLNPTELQSATFAGSWKVFELHFMILVYPDAIGT